MDAGGAEKFLLDFLSKEKSACRLVVLKGRGVYSNEFEALGITIDYLYLNRGKLQFFIKVMGELLREKPKKIICWLTYGQIFGFLISLPLKKTKLIFMYRQSIHNYSDLSIKHRMLVRVACLLMGRADVAIFNSSASKEQFCNFGASPRKSIILRNGVDKEKFKFDLGLRRKRRKELKIADDEFVVLWVGRWHREKGTDFALELATKLVNRNKNMRFIFVGVQSEEFSNLKAPLLINPQVTWFEFAKYIEEDYNAADLLVSTSRSESCPNVILEAVANSLPVLATNVGDIGHFVVPENLLKFGDFESFENKILKIGALRTARSHRENAYLAKIDTSDECFNKLKYYFRSC